MSKVQELRVFVNQRLSAAAEEIFELFERTILEYEEKLCGAKEKQHKLLNAVYNPEVRLHRADYQHLLLRKREVPPEQQHQQQQQQQEEDPGVDQEDPPEPSHIKQEQEELWNGQEGEQHQRPEEANINTIVFSPVPVKSEEDDDDVKPQSSQLYESQTEENRDTEQVKTDAENRPGPETDMNFYQDSGFQPAPLMETSQFTQCEPYYMNWYYDHTSEHQSGFNSVQNREFPLVDTKYKTPPASSSEFAPSFCEKEQLQNHNRIPVEEKPFVCSVCGQRYRYKHTLNIHMRLHSEGKHIKCPVCKKSFLWQAEIERHMRTHTGEKPFSCQFCGMRFAVSSNLNSHLQVHTGEKPFSCSVCKASFRRREGLERHMKTHTGEKPYSCTICGKRFIQHVTLKRHVLVHTGEKPYSCNICDKKFSRSEYVKTHKCVGESSGSQLS
ncbi:zinc finger protein 135-like isoform X1 [Xyrichtys novacula]|uniref:Zinc finger protein 135-like isoform X1 n=1 Tax=Xyrichtys novacula TaxID=13765 RepID=A0AAV1HAZ6_XYRNO|nr:zinc finger protein 135-like isoform X1 [Xyrichtys novacula]